MRMTCYMYVRDPQKFKLIAGKMGILLSSSLYVEMSLTFESQLKLFSLVLKPFQDMMTNFVVLRKNFKLCVPGGTFANMIQRHGNNIVLQYDC